MTVLVSVTEARMRLSEVIDHAEVDTVWLMRYSTPVAIVLSPQRYDARMKVQHK